MTFTKKQLIESIKKEVEDKQLLYTILGVIESLNINPEIINQNDILVRDCRQICDNKRLVNIIAWQCGNVDGRLFKGKSYPELRMSD